MTEAPYSREASATWMLPVRHGAHLLGNKASPTLRPIPLLPPMIRMRALASLEVYFFESLAISVAGLSIKQVGIAAG